MASQDKNVAQNRLSLNEQPLKSKHRASPCIEQIVVVADKPSNTKSTVSQVDDDPIEYDVEDLKSQQGIANISSKHFLSWTRRFPLSVENEVRTPPDSGLRRKRPIVEPEVDLTLDSPSFHLSAALMIYPMDELEQADEGTCEFTFASIFEETESFGPDVSEVIARRDNDACSKKPLDVKLKELEEKRTDN